MASKEQFEFFKTLYVEENVRYTELTKKAEVYFSVISLFLSAVLFKIKDIFDSATGLHSKFLPILFCIGLFSLGIALFLLLFSLKIRVYEGVTDMDEFIRKNDQNTQDDEDFFQDRVADYIVAIRRNEEQNDNRANQLALTGYFILAGLLVTITFIIYFFMLKI